MHSPIRRFSSRRQKLGQSFLATRLQGAQAYDRIAGYFSASILETAGEALESVTGPIRVVCNSGLQPDDVTTARAAAAALRQEWCASAPERLLDTSGESARRRFSRLYRFLHSGKLAVRVLTDEHFGLIHGKAGVITLADGTKTTFLGSVNESRRAWAVNYELLWEDSSPEAAVWVEEEFQALWSHHAAQPLSNFIVEDIQRLSQRTVISSVAGWKEGEPDEEPSAAAVFVEAPVNREQVGLWEHQKYFVKLAFDAHLHQPGGARFVLADQVGLGKTVQLAMAAELMALSGTAPVLVLAPKTLIWQWQGELRSLLALPSAVWTGSAWIDENAVEHPASGPEGIKQCPRRVGIVPTSRVTFRCPDAELLKTLNFECVIVDEAHNARRQNLGEGLDGEKAQPNNLLAFLYEISRRTKSMLLATATPVQLRPVEAWDLLDVLARGSEAVLGGTWSKWQHAEEALNLVLGNELPTDDRERWDWFRDPMPLPVDGERAFDVLRRALGMRSDQTAARGDAWEKLRQADQARVRNVFPSFVNQYNPFIRHIVRRSRRHLETTRDPATGEPYLRPIRVELFGEGEADAVRLPLYLRDAYALAEEFCLKLGERMKGSGFLRMLLLRRVGSSIAAGRLTAEKMLGSWQDVEAEDDDDEEDPGPKEGMSRTLTPEERLLLERFRQALVANGDQDPKYAVVLECLRARHWLERGCIVFSQYHDSITWLAQQLMQDFPGELIGIYAGSGRSGIWQEGRFDPVSREEIKQRVGQGRIRLLLGTDAASEGLNLQRLGTLINLDLPWNPTRLEQRKGRIQRIGQIHDEVFIYNLRYRGSVEDRVHQLLSSRMQGIHALFGQVPDVLKDVWVNVALGQEEEAKKQIAAVPDRHPFDIKYQDVQPVDWESCARVLSPSAKRDALRGTW